MKNSVPLSYYPKHIAFIMDGNRRWAKKRNLPLIDGHKKGAKVIEKILEKALEVDIKYLTFYSFSTENWKRSATEVGELQNLLSEYLESEADRFLREKIRFQTIGNLNKFSKDIRNKIIRLEEKTKNFNRLFFTLALNYGARDEILNAVSSILKKKKSINKKNFSSSLMTKNLPDPDFVIRTSGEMRISNFLLWQIAYSELYFTKTLWPDFNGIKFNNALKNYISRKRTFGSS